MKFQKNCSGCEVSFFLRKGFFGFNEVQDVISEYYKNPEGVLGRFGIE